MGHWSRVTHICVSKLTIIGVDNGLSPICHQAIIWTNDGILFILRNKLQWNLKWYSYNFIEENALENGIRKMVTILSRPQCVKLVDSTDKLFGCHGCLTSHVVKFKLISSLENLNINPVLLSRKNKKCQVNCSILLSDCQVHQVHWKISARPWVIHYETIIFI